MGMQPSTAPFNMDTQDTAPKAAARTQARRTVVVIDVAESVRLMRAGEAQFIDRWTKLVHETAAHALPPSAGRLVKSLGDGMLLEFKSAPQALAAVFAIHASAARANEATAANEQVWLRAGATVGTVHLSDLDIFGQTVDLAARLATLARPGGTVIDAPFRDAITPGLDACVRDLGECFLKHVDEPVRCFEAELAASTELRTPQPMQQATVSLQPVIAVVPLAHRGHPGGPDEHAALGDALADDIIAALSAHRAWRVVSRLSTAPFRAALATHAALARHLGATFVVSGHFAVRSDRARVQLELSETRGGAVLWAGGGEIGIAEFFLGQDALLAGAVQQIGRAIHALEVRRTRALPLPTLESYTLYLGGATLLNRLGADDFARSRSLLAHVQERVPRAAAPQAMLAKWHILRVTQGWASDVAAERSSARHWAQRALQLDPEHAFALAIDGLVAIQADGDLARAGQRYRAAIEADPQEPYTWAALSGLHVCQDDPQQAEAAARRAIALSPLDPQRFMFDCYLAVALTVAHKHEEAIEAARASLALNASLNASHRILAVAQVLAGHEHDARLTMTQLMAREPNQTVSRFTRTYPGRAAAHCERHARALRVAGMPE
jgi:class 3 adenylate cyclase/TolB-like protein/Flp pilus assembly protein TadD